MASKYIRILIAEESYRPGVWKIFYRLTDRDYEDAYSNEEIKFSGVDAQERAQEYYELMQKDKV